MSVNVTARYHGIIWAGFVIELLILILITANMLTSNKLLSLSNFLGYCSLIWFVILCIFRFDHFGKVCSGDYTEEKDNFKNITRVGYFFNMLITGIGGMIGALFLIVLLYSCCNDSRVDPEEKKKDQDKKE